MRLQPFAGRTFTQFDRAGSPRVAIINETAARRFWPNQNPIGQRVWFGGGSNFDRPDSSAEIVGVERCPRLSTACVRSTSASCRA